MKRLTTPAAIVAVGFILAIGCRGEPALPEADGGSTNPSTGEKADVDGRDVTPADGETPESDSGPSKLVADVEDVSVSGAAGDYTFSVTVASPDTGCDQYADWWEVTTTDGELVARRLLAHSHTDEQPFTRSKSSIDIAADREVVVRAHLSSKINSTFGYGGRAMRGTPADGFDEAELGPDFAADLEDAPAQPSDCAF